jgi:6-phosphogluconolactonase
MPASVDHWKLFLVNDPSDIAPAAAKQIAEALRDAITATGRATLALSGGNTPRDTYALLAREQGIVWNGVFVLWVDERAVPPGDERSNYRWAKATLLEGAPIPPENIHRMVAEREDRDVAAREYEASIRATVASGADGVPSFDVAVMGIGDDGHTASLFPGDAGVDVVDRLVVAVAGSGTREPRLTITRPLIEHARRIFFLVSGQGKRAAVERAWEDDGDVHATPARVLRGCRGQVIWIADEAAAGSLSP